VFNFNSNAIGVIDRIVDDYSVVGKDMFKKGMDISTFIGMRVTLGNDSTASTTIMGKITSKFGNAGKFNVTFDEKLTDALGNRSHPFSQLIII
jgi:ribosomal protein L35AE/L33A